MAAAERRVEMENQQALDVVDSDLPLEILYGDTWVDERLEPNLREPYQVPGHINPR